MTQFAPHVILAASDGSALAVVIGAFFLLALAAKIGALMTRLLFGVAQIGVGLIILVIIIALGALFAS